MKFNRLLMYGMLLISLLALTLFAAGCGSSEPKGGDTTQQGETGQKSETPEKKVIRLKVADMSPPTSSSAQIFQWWGSEIEKRTDGQVKFDYFWSASLVGALEQLDAVKNGSIDVTPYYSGYHPDLAPLPSITLMPMISKGSLKQALKASDELYRTHPALKAEFTKNNVKFLYPVYFPDNFMWSKVPIKTVDDLKGLKIRGFGQYLTLFKELGSNVTSMPLPEIYDALDKNVLDGTVQYLPQATGNRYWEVTKYLNTTNYGHNVGAPGVINLDKWNSLPPDIQKVIEEVSVETVEKSVQVNEEMNKKDMQAIKDNGMTVVEFSPADVEKLVKISKEKVWETYVKELDKKGIQGTDVYQTYLKLLDKYSQ